MQNTNLMATKNSVLSNLTNANSANKNMVTDVQSTEPSSFQQMFSRQLQQEQTQANQNAATQRQLNQQQLDKQQAAQQAANKAEQANSNPANSQQQEVDASQTEQKNNSAQAGTKTDAQQSGDTKSNSAAKNTKTEDSTQSAKQADASADASTNDAQDAAGKLVAEAALKADLSAGKTKAKGQGADLDQADDKLLKTADGAQDASQLAAMQAAALNAIHPATAQVEQTVKADDAAVKAGRVSDQTNLVADQGPDQTALTDKANPKALGEKGDTTGQQLFESLIGKSAANTDKSGKEQLSESLLQNNTLANMQTKEQILNPVASAPVSAYQAANALNATAATNGSSNYIGASPGKSGWDQAIGQKVVWMVGAGEQSATLNLNPPDLGPLQVVINVNNDKADTTFISQNVEVRKALEEGMSTLRDMMGQAGVELGQTNVSTQSQAQQNFEQANKNAGQSFAGSGTSNQAPEKVLSSAVITRSANGLVDTFA